MNTSNQVKYQSMIVIKDSTDIHCTNQGIPYSDHLEKQIY